MKFYRVQIVVLVLFVATNVLAGDKGTMKYVSAIGIRQGTGVAAECQEEKVFSARAGNSILSSEAAGPAQTPKASISLAGETAGITVYHFEGASDEVAKQAVVLFTAPQRMYSHSILSLPPKERMNELVLPSEYVLHQNYPNPFNPSATIQYDLPAESRVELSVYNALGQRVTTLVDEVQESGYKFVEWDAANFASGIYFYRLTATHIADASKSIQYIRKMVLMK